MKNVSVCIRLESGGRGIQTLSQSSIAVRSFSCVYCIVSPPTASPPEKKALTEEEIRFDNNFFSKDVFPKNDSVLIGIQITCFLLKSILEEIRDVETLVLVQVLTFFFHWSKSLLYVSESGLREVFSSCTYEQINILFHSVGYRLGDGSRSCPNLPTLQVPNTDQQKHSLQSLSGFLKANCACLLQSRQLS